MLRKALSAIALVAIGTLSMSGVATAADTEKTVRDAFSSLLPNAKIDRVTKSEVPGFYEVIVGGQVVYVSADGKYLLQGNLYDVALDPAAPRSIYWAAGDAIWHLVR